MTKYFDVNEAGHSIRCKLYCNDEHRIGKLILFGQGFGSHKDNKAAEKFALRVLSKFKATAVMTFNWPCHGDDVKKKLLLSDCDAYITAVLQYVQQHYTQDVSVYATSFGGYLFLKYLTEHGNPFGRLALRCPAVDMYGVLTRRVMEEDALRKLEKGKDAEIGFDRKIRVSRQFLNDLQAADLTARDFLDYAEDLLIIHGTKDEVVPFAWVQKFADDQLIELIPVENADHRFQNPRAMDTAIQAIVDFLEPV